ncbi:Osmotin-like protein OSM34 [Abeliophyllum distichum]|uniref:Osmotin-like protein OSM34 n=1 Tax=Abeliophyllum distichum TaxID=126358 RepID=A0ABD1SGC6_9LAMI
MSFLNSPFAIFAIFIPRFFIYSHEIIIRVQNNCPYKVWAAALPRGGCHLDRGQTRALGYPSTKSVKIWGQTNCTFDSFGNGKCLIGDCDGLLECKDFGAAPVTLVLIRAELLRREGLL